MKNLLLCVLSLLFATALSAQDVIIKKDADEVKAKVLEIGETTVTYKKFSNPNGPSYTIPKSDIFMIKYQNGDKEVFKEEAPKVTQVQTEPQVDTYEQERLERIEQQRLIKEKAELKRRKLMGKHNIKVTFGGGLGATPFEEKTGYDDMSVFGGSIDFNVVYNQSIFDYTGDWGIGLGITNFRGTMDGVSNMDFMKAVYLNIPLELTYRGKSVYTGMSLNAGIPVSYRSEYKGMDGLDSVDDADLCKFRLGIGWKFGFQIRKFDIGLFYTWWPTNMYGSDAFTSGGRYNPSHQFGVNMAYRIKIM